MVGAMYSVFTYLDPFGNLSLSLADQVKETRLDSPPTVDDTNPA